MSSDHLYPLVLLYLAVAYEPDQTLDPRERQEAIRLAGQWVSGLEPERTHEVVDAAITATRSGHRPELETLARELGEALGPDHRRRVLTDLGQIARADGYLSTGEAGLISRIRAIWGSL